MDAKAQSQDDGQGREYLAFSLGGEEYVVDILKVQEIRTYEGVTRIANMPPFIKGVMNLRGTVVPVVDLRIRFNVGKAEYDATTIVIVMNIGKRTIGVVVDGVFIGATRTADMRNAALAAFALYLLAWWLFQPLGNHGLWAAMAFGYAARAGTLLRYYPALVRSVPA